MHEEGGGKKTEYRSRMHTDRARSQKCQKRSKHMSKLRPVSTCLLDTEDFVCKQGLILAESFAVVHRDVGK